MGKYESRGKAEVAQTIQLGLDIFSLGRFCLGPPRISGLYRTHGLHFVPSTYFTHFRSHPPIMNCPLKGRFIYWGFVIPVSVLRLFK